MDLPVVFDHELAKGGSMPYRWDEEYGARLGVLRRDEPYGAVRWFAVDPCYVFHPLNAHDDGDRIVVHVMRYPELWRPGAGSRRATLWRWTIDLVTGEVAEEQLDDRPGEFPRVDDRLVGLDSRFGHVTASGKPAGGGEVGTGDPSGDQVEEGDVEEGGAREGGALLRYDLRTGAVTGHDFGPGRFPAEASFAPADDSPGGAGWLLTYVYDAATDRSDLVILDSADLTAPPVATVHLPGRVPYGFHGNWLADL
jgi:carotenoid cleavage dioxygenase